MAIVFYIVVNAAGLDLGELRQAGWLFSLPSTPGGSWYKFYTYFRTSVKVNSRSLLIGCRLEMDQVGSAVVNTSYSICVVSVLMGLYGSALNLPFFRLFFNVLHPPLNVPALGKSDTCDDDSFLAS